MKKILTFLLSFILCSSLFIAPAFAQPNITGQLDAVGQAGFGQQSSQAASRSFIPAINSIIGFFLGFVGTIAFVVFLVGGFLWMTARGNEGQVETAKKYMFNGTLGVIIIIMAYSLAFFLTEFVFRATSGSNAG